MKVTRSPGLGRPEPARPAPTGRDSRSTTAAPAAPASLVIRSPIGVTAPHGVPLSTMAEHLEGSRPFHADHPEPRSRSAEFERLGAAPRKESVPRARRRPTGPSSRRHPADDRSGECARPRRKPRSRRGHRRRRTDRACCSTKAGTTIPPSRSTSVPLLRETGGAFPLG